MPHLKTPEADIFYEQFGEGPDIVWVSGGGSLGRDWHPFQVPHFEKNFRCTTFDNRGIGETTSTTAMPWDISVYAQDVAALIEQVCTPPVSLVGLSFGSAIAQQVVIEYPNLIRSAVVMGTGAWSTDWGWDYQEAEIEFRKAGGRLDGMMGVCHYAAMLYPARVLGDRDLWPKIRTMLQGWMESGENEESLIPQWDASLRFDQRDQLTSINTPVHVIAFEEDVQAPPQDGEELANMIPGAEFHLMAGMGHGSIYGHTHDQLNLYVEELIRRHL